jgi:glycosyltransferase involved in cell wall biosynthesis
LLAGGSESAALWGIQALRRDYAVGLVTGCPFDLDRLNEHCGTRLVGNDLRASVGSQWPRRLIGHTDALRGSLFARYARSQAYRFEVCISGYNLLDFGKPAIQLIADFAFDDALRRQYDPLPEGGRRWGYWSPLLRRGYLGLAHAVGGRSGYDGSGDWVVANSHWTAGILKSRLGMSCARVIYPPVVGAGDDTPWKSRERGFVVLGRVSPEKRIDQVIRTLGRVRARGHDVVLRVIGPIGDDAYGHRVRGLIAENADWCIAEGALAGVAKSAMLARHRFAIHGREGEPFGIAVAEEMKAGCIPFVPREGGPAEIVGTDELTYAEEEEAVAKIVGVLENPARQGRLRAHLAERAACFSSERYMSEIRSLVADWFAHRRGAGM